MLHLKGPLSKNVGVREQNWRKCSVVVDKLSNELHNFEHNFNNEDKQHVLRRFLNKEDVKNLLPKFQWNFRATEQKLAFFDNVRVAYAHLVSHKSRDNRHYKNALLSVIVSIETSPSTRFIFKTIGNSRYLLSKVVTWKIHVELKRENLGRFAMETTF